MLAILAGLLVLRYTRNASWYERGEEERLILSNVLDGAGRSTTILRNDTQWRLAGET